MVATDGEQRRFIHEIREVGAGHAGRSARAGRDVDIIGDGLVAQVDLEDAFAALEVRRIHDDLPVETTRTQQRRIEDVRAVRGGDENYAVIGLEAVHLDEQLVERLLTLIVAAAEAGTAVPTDRVDLVDEDDAGRVGLSLFEKITHSRRTDADEHLDEIRSGHREERTSGFAGNRAGKQRLAGTRRTDEQRAFGQTPAKLRELLRVAQELDDLLQLLLRLVGTGDIREGHLRGVPGEQLRLRLAERERLRAASLHLSEQEQIEADEQQPRQKVEDVCRDRRPSIFGFDDHGMLVQAVDFGLRILHRKAHVELRHVAAVVRNRRLEFARDVLPRLDLHLADVVAVELGLVLGIADERSLLGPRAGQLNERDGNEQDEEPERERLRETAPVHVLLWRLRRSRYWHLLQARDVRKVTEIFRVIQPVSDKELVRRVEPNKASWAPELRRYVLV